MKISVNLATRPYVELRPVFLRMRILMGALAVVVVGLFVATHMLDARVQREQAQMAELQAQTQTALAEKAANERRMKLPQNAATLERARALNEIFLRKSFSWTSVMMDLERVLPPGVMVTALQPQTSPDGTVSIQMRVGGDRDRAVQLVRNLERSRRFLDPELRGEASQSKENGQGQAQPANAPPAGVEFEIVAKYNPVSEEEVAASKRAEEVKPKTIAPKPAAPNAAGKYPKDGVVLPPHQPGQPTAQGGKR